MRHRHVVHDNIATPGAPVWRARYATPLTPRTVRDELAKQSNEQPECNREGWMQARLTLLDRLLTTEEADALEMFVFCEAALAGNARGTDYTGDRIQSSRSEMEIIPKAWLADLARHHDVRKHLSATELQMLATFCEQQAGEGYSEAEAALRYGLPGKHKRQAWADCLAEIARKLARIG